MSHIERDYGPSIVRRFHTAHHAGATPKGDHHRVLIIAPIEQGAYILCIAGISNYIGRVRKIACKGADRIRERIAITMEQTLIRLRSTNSRQRSRSGKARGPQPNFLDCWRRRYLELTDPIQIGPQTL